MLKAWCMFDNHTFASVPLVSKQEIVARVQRLRDLRAGMSLFVRDGDRELGQHVLFGTSPFELHGDDLTDEEIAVWADKVLEEVAFRKLMDA